MVSYIILSNGRLVWSSKSLKKIKRIAKRHAISQGRGYEVVKSLGVFEGGSGKFLKNG